MSEIGRPYEWGPCPLCGAPEQKIGPDGMLYDGTCTGFERYLSLAIRRKMLNRDERKGQAYFNALYDVRPDLAQNAPDPFYNDEKLPEFLVWVEENWHG